MSWGPAIPVACVLLLSFAPVGAAQTVRASVSDAGGEANALSVRPAVSGDGRYIAFESDATNLVPGDTNRQFDVFVHDRLARSTTRVSVGTNGEQGGGFDAAISASGRFVAFGSFGPLVGDDRNMLPDVYLHDSAQAATVRVSVANDGSDPNGPSVDASVSADGRMVVFTSDASNLVSGDVNQRQDVFARDIQTGQTTLVSVAADGTPGNGSSSAPRVSHDGRLVVFMSLATNLVSGDTNDSFDVFVRDLVTGTTSRVSVASDGAQANDDAMYPDVSGDGRHVAFDSNATNLVASDTNGVADIFVHDRATGQTSRVSVGSGGTQADIQSIMPALNGDGRLVAFSSFATNLVADDTNGYFDVFVHDRQTGETNRVSVASDGTQANGFSGIYLTEAALAADGSVAAFGSDASNLVDGDANGTCDVFAHVLSGGAVPGRPVHLTADVVGSTVSLTWDAPMTGAPVDSYIVRVGFQPFARDLAFEVGAVPVLRATGVPLGTYYVRVHGRNAAGVGRPSREVAVVMAAPGAPERLRATVQATTVTLEWDATTGGGSADGHLLHAGLEPGGSAIELALGGTRSYQAEQVPVGTYFVHVHARNVFGAGPPSNEVVVAIAPCGEPPPPPSGLRAALSGRTVELTWLASTGCAATSYVLEAGTRSGAADVFVGNVGGQTRLVATVSPGTYYVRVRGQNGAGTGPPSGEVVVVVP